MHILLKVVFLIFLGTSFANNLSDKLFPSDFIFGVSTSAYQIEGAWNESGKGPSMLDYITHIHTTSIVDGSNGDIACDSYHKVDEDIALLKELGVNFYRFSLSWSRIVPTGNISDGIKQDGVNYYLGLLDKLQTAGIDAMVTLLHFDTPMDLIRKKIFIDEYLNNLFTEYARLAFQLFGSKVKYWITFNEPAGYCANGMNTFYPNPGKDAYLCAHNVIKSHAAVYHLYNNEFKEQYGGQVSIVLNTDWYEPASDSESDIEAAERALMFMFGWIAHPIIYGDYPEIMKERITAYTPTLFDSRLPEFTYEEKKFIKGTIDFIGLNHYSTYRTSNEPNDDIKRTYAKDLGILTTVDPSWETTMLDWLHVVPSGMRKVLGWISKTYENIPIFITENGYADNGTLEDDRRINYLQTYLSNVLDAIYSDNINVIGYASWSFLDNWELNNGYTAKFGLYYVNFTNPNRERIAKKSVATYKKLLETRCLVENCS